MNRLDWDVKMEENEKANEQKLIEENLIESKDKHFLLIGTFDSYEAIKENDKWKVNKLGETQDELYQSIESLYKIDLSEVDKAISRYLSEMEFLYDDGHTSPDWVHLKKDNCELSPFNEKQREKLVKLMHERGNVMWSDEDRSEYINAIYDSLNELVEDKIDLRLIIEKTNIESINKYYKKNEKCDSYEKCKEEIENDRQNSKLQ